MMSLLGVGERAARGFCPSTSPNSRTEETFSLAWFLGLASGPGVFIVIFVFLVWTNPSKACTNPHPDSASYLVYSILILTEEFQFGCLAIPTSTTFLQFRLLPCKPANCRKRLSSKKRPQRTAKRPQKAAQRLQKNGTTAGCHKCHKPI